MRIYTSQEIQVISAEFRSVARRLSRTDYSQCTANLKRFMVFLENTELVKKFISEKNVHKYQIDDVIKNRGWLSPFEISHIVEEEISLEVQLLEYSIENYDGDFTRLYGTQHYTATKSTTNDEMRKFISHVVDPLIDYICEYLRYCYDIAKRNEEKEKPAPTPSFTATNSTILIGSQVSGDVKNKVVITESEKTDANELILAIESAIFDNANKEDILELLKQIKDDVALSKKPKKGILTALKVLCQTGSTVIPFVTALIEMFS